MSGFRWITVTMGVALMLAIVSARAPAGEPGPLVTAKWLSQNLDRDDLVVLDIRNPIGAANKWTYLSGHIPGAVYSNYVAGHWHDNESRAPATLPPTEQIESLLGSLGISNDSSVVVVHSGLHSSDFSTAARVYWLFKLMGHDRVAILDGGFRSWQAANLPVEEGWNPPTPTTFQASVRPDLLADTGDVVAAIEGDVQLVDGRAQELYLGLEKADLATRYGTIPGAVNMPHRDMVDPETGLFVSGERLAALLREAGVDPQRETIVFCSIGHWSATTWFALHELSGFADVRLYDGSMVEWTQAPERPVKLGAEVGQGTEPP